MLKVPVAVHQILVEDVQNFQGDQAENGGRLKSVNVRMRVEDERQRETALTPREVLEENQQNEQKGQQTERNVIGRNFVIEVQFRLEQRADLRRRRRGEIVQLLKRFQMFDFELEDRLAAERGEEQREEADRQASQVEARAVRRAFGNGRRIDANGRVGRPFQQFIGGKIRHGVELLSRRFRHRSESKREEKERRLTTTTDRKEMKMKKENDVHAFDSNGRTRHRPMIV